MYLYSIFDLGKAEANLILGIIIFLLLAFDYVEPKVRRKLTDAHDTRIERRRQRASRITDKRQLPPS